MKKFFFLSFIFCLFLFSCQKTYDISPTRQLAYNESDFEYFTEHALFEIFSLLSDTSIDPATCGINVDTIVSNDTTTLIFKFDGYHCHSFLYRIGRVLVSAKTSILPTDAGAEFIFSFENYAVCKQSNGNTQILNGIIHFSNSSGGSFSSLNGQNELVFVCSCSDFFASFLDGAVCRFNLSKRLTFTGIKGNLFLKTEGTASKDGYNSVSDWGINRENINFITQISNPVIMKEQCNWNAISGNKTEYLPSEGKTFSIYYGFDINGIQVSGSACPVKARVDWQDGKQSGSLYIGY